MFYKKQRLNSLEDEVKGLFSENINNIEDFVRKSLDTKDRDIRVHKLAFGTLSRQNKELASKNEELRREVLISEEHHSFSQKLEKELEQCKITLQEVKERNENLLLEKEEITDMTIHFLVNSCAMEFAKNKIVQSLSHDNFILTEMDQWNENLDDTKIEKSTEHDYVSFVGHNFFLS